jgi:hypothetical protein
VNELALFPNSFLWLSQAQGICGLEYISLSTGQPLARSGTTRLDRLVHVHKQLESFLSNDSHPYLRELEQWTLNNLD